MKSEEDKKEQDGTGAQEEGEVQVGHNDAADLQNVEEAKGQTDLEEQEYTEVEEKAMFPEIRIHNATSEEGTQEEVKHTEGKVGKDFKIYLEEYFAEHVDAFGREEDDVDAEKKGEEKGTEEKDKEENIANVEEEKGEEKDRVAADVKMRARCLESSSSSSSSSSRSSSPSSDNEEESSKAHLLQVLCPSTTTTNCGCDSSNQDIPRSVLAGTQEREKYKEENSEELVML